MQVNAAVQVDGTECDVSSPASVARLVSIAKSKLGRIDVWITNAGYSGSFQVKRSYAFCCCVHSTIALTQRRTTK